MGVFSPAIFLYENNFDILSLIQEPDWWLGGTNVHAFSAWQNDREGLAVACALIVLSIKLTGVAIAASTCVVLLFRFFSTPKLIRVWHVIFIPTFYIVLRSIYSWLGGSDVRSILNDEWRKRIQLQRGFIQAFYVF